MWPGVADWKLNCWDLQLQNWTNFWEQSLGVIPHPFSRVLYHWTAVCYSLKTKAGFPSSRVRTRFRYQHTPSHFLRSRPPYQGLMDSCLSQVPSSTEKRKPGRTTGTFLFLEGNQHFWRLEDKHLVHRPLYLPITYISNCHSQILPLCGDQVVHFRREPCAVRLRQGVFRGMCEEPSGGPWLATQSTCVTVREPALLLASSFLFFWA